MSIVTFCGTSAEYEPYPESMQHIFNEPAEGASGNILRATALSGLKRGGFSIDPASRGVTSEPSEKYIENSRLVVIVMGLLEDRIRDLATTDD